MPYIGKSTTIGVRQRYMYTATASQTTFSGTDTQNLTLNYTDSNFVDVYLNGVLLKTGTDYTATSGTSVVLASGAVADDIVEIIVYDTFAVANFYNRTDSDSRYVNIDGDTMTGALAGTTATFSGIIKTDDTTDATSTTDGSLQTDGGLSVVKKSVFGDDVTIISGSSPEIKIAPNDATAAFFKGDSNRSSAGQHLTEFQGYWNGTQVARIVVAAGDDTTNKDDGHLDFYTTPSGGSSTRAMRIKSDGFVGIGTDSPAYRLHQHESTSGENYHLFTNSTTGTTSSDGFRIGIDSNENALVWHREANSIQFATSNTERAVFGTSEAVFNEASNDYNFRVESDGNANMLFVDAGNNRVGLGTNAPDSFAHFQNADSTMEHRIETTATNGTAQTKYKNDAQQYSVGVNNVDQFFLYDVTAAKHRLEVNSTEMVINDDSANTDFRIESDGNANMLFVDAGNNSVGIGDSAPPSSVKLAIQTDGIGLRLDGTADTTRTIFFRNTTTSNPAQILADGSLRLRTEDASTAIIFNTNSSGTNNEAVRIDGSQNFFVGKSSISSTTAGLEFGSNNKLAVTRDGAQCAAFVRLSSPGPIIELQQASSVRGRIGVNSNNYAYIANSASGGAGVAFGAGTALIPVDQDGAHSDNTKDVGASSVRFDDIHATNGTIQTSDENEKQDIASMTTAELAVGKRLSTLFKTFRWKDKVTEKGDKARTHSGIVAQQVKTAFEAEGLDATKYALFCSDTWTNDDGKEQTRLGVRYPQLLSFIASYNESRFTAIEARIAKLEGA